MGGRVAALTVVALVTLARPVTAATPLSGMLGLPKPLEFLGGSRESSLAAHAVSSRPHPAVARIVVPEGNTAVSYGSGTLVDVRDQFGLVVTNWHVVRDGTGEVEVIFPDGFRSKARPLKVDSDWDLAALVIWRPSVQPVALAAVAPQPGDQLTICGYGSGEYRAATGRCTQYYAPSLDLPQHMVELDVEARQGDSGGPIFNDRGELAGVLFGAGRGTTLGSFGGRVSSFLATLAPNIGADSLAATAPDQSKAAPTAGVDAPDEAGGWEVSAPTVAHTSAPQVEATAAFVSKRPDGAPETLLAGRQPSTNQAWHATAVNEADRVADAPPSTGAFEHARNVLAVIGAAALLMQLLRAVL